MQTAGRPRVLVIGGSMSGLFAAVLLRKAGCEVQIFERAAADLTGRGAGIVTHAAMTQALAAAGCDMSHNLGVEVAMRRTLDRAGHCIGEFGCRQTVTSWDRVFRMLREQCPAQVYCRGKELVSLTQDGDSVSARFSDGSTATGDLLVGADGFRSTVRAQILPAVPIAYAGYIGWRGLVGEAALAREARTAIFDAMVFCLPPGEQFISYPIVGRDSESDGGHRRCNFVWYRPARPAALRAMLTDASGHTHAFGIPPPLVRGAVTDELRAAAQAELAPALAEVVRLAPQPFLQPISDVETPRMAVGRVVLIGDAAFLARPHVAAGVTKAAEDAMVLAEAICGHDDVGAAVVAFEQTRIAANRRIMTRGRDLGGYLCPDLPSEERVAAERHHTPEAVMREIAVLDF